MLDTQDLAAQLQGAAERLKDRQFAGLPALLRAIAAELEARIDGAQSGSR